MGFDELCIVKDEKNGKTIEFFSKVKNNKLEVYSHDLKHLWTMDLNLFVFSQINKPKAQPGTQEWLNCLDSYEETVRSNFSLYVLSDFLPMNSIIGSLCLVW
jgi:hypothetical protein